MHVAFGAALAGGLGLLIAEPAWPVAARVLAEGLALFLCVRGLRWVAVPAVFAAAVLPPAGHAAGVIPAAGAEFADALHVLSAARRLARGGGSGAPRALRTYGAHRIRRHGADGSIACD